MEQPEQVQVHECCLVAYRVTSSGVEFCLLTPNAENRWEFPKIAIEPGSTPQLALLEQIATESGLVGAVSAGKALGFFAAKRGQESREMTGYLMRVTAAEDAWPRKESFRRLWCLAEEARVRIRRKPLRRFIDLALHHIAEADAPAGGVPAGPTPRPAAVGGSTQPPQAHPGHPSVQHAVVMAVAKRA